MKFLPLVALLALAACENPMLAAEMAVSNDGVQVSPAISGVVGNTTISAEVN